MSDRNIVHLVDDTTPGGVMRMLDHLSSHPQLARHCTQTVRAVGKSGRAHGRIEADVIVSHLAISWRGLPALMALRALHPQARLVHIEHSYTREFTALNVGSKTRFFALLRVAYALFDRVVSVSEDQADWMRTQRLVHTEALRVIEPRVDLSAFSVLDAPDRPVRTIGAIGRLEPQKGFDILIPAFRTSAPSDARLMIFGEGSQMSLLQELAGDDSRITFCGHLSDPVKAYDQVDAVAMPSRWEAFGLVAREALAARRPVVAAQVDGLSDLRGAQLVNDLRPDSWALALEPLFAGEAAVVPEEDTDQAERRYAQLWQEVFFAPDEATVDQKDTGTPTHA